MRFFLTLIGTSWLLGASPVSAQDVRYFAVWSFLQNAPTQEVPADARSGRKLGYWALNFDEEGQVLGGAYHGADGTEWLHVRYVQVVERIYVDLFSPDGTHRSRKSTTLSDRRPRSLGPQQ